MIELSIIIPYKDTPNTLFQLLETIPDRPEYEVILVDDGSEAPFDISDFQRTNIHTYLNRSDAQGAGAARNIGVSKARGKWLVFADSDDWFSENAFSIFNKYINSKADIIYFNPTSRYHASGCVGTRHRDYAALVYEFIKYDSDWIRFRFHSPWSKMIRRDLFTKNQISFDETIVANDIVCSLKLGLYAHGIEASDETVYVVRQGRPNSLSSMQEEEFFDIRLNNHFRYNSIICEYSIKDRTMGGASILRKALGLGYAKFFSVLFLFIRSGQPITERRTYYLILARRKLRRLQKIVGNRLTLILPS